MTFHYQQRFSVFVFVSTEYIGHKAIMLRIDLKETQTKIQNVRPTKYVEKWCVRFWLFWSASVSDNIVGDV